MAESSKFKTKPVTVIALCIALVSIALDWYWPWGILLLWWIWNSVSLGETYFVEPITRSENPVLFWAINAMWLFFAIAAFIYEINPEFLLP